MIPPDTRKFKTIPILENRCNTCMGLIDQKELAVSDGMPPMMAYTNRTVARCNICKRPLCKDCWVYFGFGVFTCKEECQTVKEDRIRKCHDTTN